MDNELATNEQKDVMFKLIDLGLLEENEGQLDGLPANPREILTSKYELLKKNISEHPEFLKYNMLKVYPLDNGHYIIIGGNMRFKALKELGFKEVPCAVIDAETSVEDLKAYTVIDNNSFGKWEWSMLANEWDAAQLTDWGVDLPIMGEEINMDSFFDEEEESSKDKGEKLTISIPEDLTDAKEEIKKSVEALLESYEGCKVK